MIMQKKGSKASCFYRSRRLPVVACEVLCDAPQAPLKLAREQPSLFIWYILKVLQDFVIRRIKEYKKNILLTEALKYLILISSNFWQAAVYK